MHFYGHRCICFKHHKKSASLQVNNQNNHLDVCVETSALTSWYEICPVFSVFYHKFLSPFLFFDNFSVVLQMFTLCLQMHDAEWRLPYRIGCFCSWLSTEENTASLIIIIMISMGQNISITFINLK